MAKLAIWLILGASVAGAGEGEFQWPADGTYKGTVRSAIWWEGMWGRFKGMILIVEGTAIDRQHLYGQEARVGIATKILGKVERVMAEDEVIVSFLTGAIGGPFGGGLKRKMLYVKGMATKGFADGENWTGTVAIVGTASVGGQTLLSARPLPKERPPLTRPEFLAVVQGGFELAIWTRTPKPKGLRDPWTPDYTDYRNAIP